MKPYRKRAYESWNAGKGNKGPTTERPERQFAKREIAEQLKEAEENYLARYHKGKRTRNEKARLEYRIKWYEERIAYWGDKAGSLTSHFRSALREARKDLRAYLDKKGQV